MNRSSSNKTRSAIVALALLAASTQILAGQALQSSEPYPAVAASAGGFVVLAENRFDPLVQRLMAEHSLKSLPLSNGRLYYLYPINLDPHVEEMQIRYMQQLLEKGDAEKAYARNIEKNEESDEPMAD